MAAVRGFTVGHGTGEDDQPLQGGFADLGKLGSDTIYDDLWLIYSQSMVNNG